MVEQRFPYRVEIHARYSPRIGDNVCFISSRYRPMPNAMHIETSLLHTSDILGQSYSPQTHASDYHDYRQHLPYNQEASPSRSPNQAQADSIQNASSNPLPKFPVAFARVVETKDVRQVPMVAPSWIEVWNIAPPTDCSSLFFSKTVLYLNVRG
jgi:hypothetical protein